MNTSRNRVGLAFTGPKSGNWKSAAVFAVFLLVLVAGNRAQTTLPGNVTGFTSNQYFEPPNYQQVKMRLSGASATPLPGGALDITDLKIETFTLSGKTQAIVRAPQCTFSPFDGVASSPGHLELQTGDGKMWTTGDGFLWRQSDNSLTISNNVHTVMQLRAMKLSIP
jgi:hypothetical protein